MNIKKMLIASVLFFALSFFLINHFFPDTEINKYANLEEVKKNTAIQKGFIPAILPVSAHTIVESHDLETNTTFGSFKYEEKDEAAFLQNLTDLHDADHTLEWGNFLFKMDKKLNLVMFRNKPNSINKQTP